MEESARGTRRGSEKRQRSRAVTVRFTPAELANLHSRAERRGLSPASYCRETLIGAAGPRARRQHPANVDELRRLLGAIGKVGANVNQIAAAANRGDWVAGDELAAAAGDIRALRAAIMQALGRSP